MTGVETFCVIVKSLGLLNKAFNTILNYLKGEEFRERATLTLETKHQLRCIQQILSSLMGQVQLTPVLIENLIGYVATVVKLASAQRQHKRISVLLCERLYEKLPEAKEYLHLAQRNTEDLHVALSDPEIASIIEGSDGIPTAAPPIPDGINVTYRTTGPEKLIELHDNVVNKSKQNTENWQRACEQLKLDNIKRSELAVSSLSLLLDLRTMQRCDEDTTEIERQIRGNRYPYFKHEPKVFLVPYIEDSGKRNTYAIEEMDLALEAGEIQFDRDWNQQQQRQQRQQRMWVWARASTVTTAYYKSIRLFSQIEACLNQARQDAKQKHQDLLDSEIDPDFLRELERRITMLYATLSTDHWSEGRERVLDDSSRALSKPRKFPKPADVAAAHHLKTPIEVTFTNVVLELKNLVEKRQLEMLKSAVSNLIANDADAGSPMPIE